jgi:hypothetical protein
MGTKMRIISRTIFIRNFHRLCDLQIDLDEFAMREETMGERFNPLLVDGDRANNYVAQGQRIHF